MTAGQISPNNSGIGGQIVDFATKAPIAGNVLVAIEQTDNTGIDRIVMETNTDASGNFRFCPLPPGRCSLIPTNSIPSTPLPLAVRTSPTTRKVLRFTVSDTASCTPTSTKVSVSSEQPPRLKLSTLP